MSTMAPADAKVSSDLIRRVGIVAIGRNEGERLADCLDRALQDCRHVVYADSASSDGSPGLARRRGVLVVELDATRSMTAARGRREGFAALMDAAPALDFVQFVDGDCVLQEGWLDSAVAFLDSHPRAAAVCGRRFEARPGDSIYNRMIDQEWDTPVGQADACGGDALMRASALRDIGSFRPDLVAGEEPELCSRLRTSGWTVWRIDVLMTEHDANILTFAQWWKRSVRGGMGYAQIWSITQKAGVPLYGRQIASALLWAIAIPLLVIAAAVVTRSAAALTALPIIYLVQWARIAWRRRQQGLLDALKSAAVTLGVKWAEAMGVMRYLLSGSHAVSTSYRDAPHSAAVAGKAS